MWKLAENEENKWCNYEFCDYNLWINLNKDKRLERFNENFQSILKIHNKNFFNFIKLEEIIKKKFYSLIFN